MKRPVVSCVVLLASWGLLSGGCARPQPVTAGARGGQNVAGLTDTPVGLSTGQTAASAGGQGVTITIWQGRGTNVVRARLAAGGKQPDTAAERRRRLQGVFGTYNAAPRGADGRVDRPRLLRELTALKAHTYNWLIWHAPTDWEDLQEFLPEAAALGLRVWVTLVPPSESPPRTSRFSEPFRLDYERWAVEIARLSARHANLVAWSIDDFAHNLAVFPPERLERMLAGARALDPLLGFVPCVYYRQCRPEFARAYGSLCDALLFPYRNESGEMNLQQAEALPTEVSRLRELLGPDLPIIVDVYATKHSRLNESSPEYVARVMRLARQSADGVLVYCHQDPAVQPAKFAVLRELFHAWAAERSRY